MTIVTRFGALAALSALAACATSNSTPGATSTVDVSGMLAKAGTYDAVTTEEHTSLNAAVRDAALAGVAGFMGFEDGTVKPIRVRISSDTTKAYISIDGAPEIEMDFASSSYNRHNFSNSDGNFSINLSDYSGAHHLYSDGFENDGRGYFGIEAAADTLPEGNAAYAGSYYLQGQQGDYGRDYSSGQIALSIDFGEGTVKGSLIGSINLPTEFVPEDEYDYYYGYYDGGIYGDISGSVEGGRFAAMVDVVGNEVSGYDREPREIEGSLEMLGSFYYEGDTVAGGIGGTISESTMGGEFSASEGYYR